MPLSNSSATTTGWVVFIAALGMLLGMIAVDITGLNEWAQMRTPFFVGTTIGHIAAVIAAFVGGKMIPEAHEGQKTRSTDIKGAPNESE